MQACAAAADVHTQQWPTEWVCRTAGRPAACTFLATPHHESTQTHGHTGQQHKLHMPPLIATEAVCKQNNYNRLTFATVQSPSCVCSVHAQPLIY
jgi:hypothetical protein